MRQATGPKRRRRAFTLIELAIVMLIIGLLITFILMASNAGIQRAQARATEGLITKLEVGMNDRIAALLSHRVAAVGTHNFLAAVWPSSAPAGTNPAIWGLPSDQRAQVIALFDYYKSELPDVFFLQVNPANLPTTFSSGNGGIYPLNFAGLPYPPSAQVQPSPANAPLYRLPLGHHSTLYAYGQMNQTTNPPTPFNGPGDGQPLTDPGSGIYGASYMAAGGIHKALGYQPTGYDGLDNDGDGFTDDWNEGIFGLNASQVQVIINRLTNHTHKTARSEALYALLVNGLGPLGSIFNPDDFTEREVQDTDGDGLPEFVDGWGEPLRFYRWPIGYNSDVQKGFAAYLNLMEQREQDPLDPSQALVAPSWWFNAVNSNNPNAQVNAPPAMQGAPMSGPAWTFAQYFHNIVDPNSGGATGTLWDRSGASLRRAYFTKFLIVSAGPDRQLGRAEFGLDYSTLDDTGTIPSGQGGVPIPSGNAVQDALNLILIENQAAAVSPFRTTTPVPTFTNPYTGVINTILNTSAQDDIANQKLTTPGVGLQ